MFRELRDRTELHPRVTGKYGDPDIVGQHRLTEKLMLTPAQGSLLDTYLCAQVQQRRIRLLVDESWDWERDLKGIQTTDPYSSKAQYLNKGSLMYALEWQSSEDLFTRAKIQSEIMTNNPEMSYIALLVELRSFAPADWESRALRPWMDPSGKLTQRGIEILKSPVGAPGNVRDLAFHFSTIYSTVPSKLLPDVISGKIALLSDRKQNSVLSH